MATIFTPDCVEAQIRCTLFNVPVENVFSFYRPAHFNQTDVNNLAEAIDEWVGTSLLPLTTTYLTYRETYVKGVNTGTALQGTANASAGLGTGGSTPLPANVSKAITFSSGLTGRSSRGRMFINGLSTSAVVLGSDTMLQSFIDDFIDALEALKTIIEALGWVWVIISKYHDGAPRASGITFPITQFKVSNLTTDSMRGRLPRF